MINFERDVTGSHSGQTNHIMTISVNGRKAGYVQYAVYNGEPSIQYIHVHPDFRRQGLATKLMKELQKEFPDTTIHLGMATDMGAPFVKSLARKFYPNLQYDQARAKLAQLKAREAELQKMWDDMPEQIDDDYRRKMEPYWDEMNVVHDAIRELEDELRETQLGKWIIESFKGWINKT